MENKIYQYQQKQRSPVSTDRHSTYHNDENRSPDHSPPNYFRSNRPQSSNYNSRPNHNNNKTRSYNNNKKQYRNYQTNTTEYVDLTIDSGYAGSCHNNIRQTSPPLTWMTTFGTEIVPRTTVLNMIRLSTTAHTATTTTINALRTSVLSTTVTPRPRITATNRRRSATDRFPTPPKDWTSLPNLTYTKSDQAFLK